MVFIRFQYHLQRHFVVLVVARLVVDITIMQVPIATRRFVFIPMDLQDLSVGLLQVPNKQWGINTGGAVRTSTLPIPFTNVFLAVASTSSEWCCPGCSATNTTVTTRAYQSNRPDVAQPNDVNWIIIGCQPQWGNSASLSGYVAVCIFPISFTTTDYTAVATGVMSAADATFGKENYVNNILWDFTSESQVAFRLSHLDRPTLRYIAIGF